MLHNKPTESSVNLTSAFKVISISFSDLGDKKNHHIRYATRIEFTSRNTYHFFLALHNNHKSIFILGWFNTNDILVDQGVVLVAMSVCQVKWFLQTTQND
jgi:hypothetical protein